MRMGTTKSCIVKFVLVNLNECDRREVEDNVGGGGTITALEFVHVSRWIEGVDHSKQLYLQ